MISQITGVRGVAIPWLRVSCCDGFWERLPVNKVLLIKAVLSIIRSLTVRMILFELNNVVVRSGLE